MDSRATPVFEQEQYAANVARKIRSIEGISVVPMYLIVESNTRASAFNIIRVLQAGLPLIKVVTDLPRKDNVRRIGVETTVANKGHYLDTFITQLAQDTVSIAHNFHVMGDEDEAKARKAMLDAVGRQLLTIKRDGNKWSGKFNASGKPDASASDDIAVTITILVRNIQMLRICPESYVVSSNPIDSLFSVEY